MNEPLCRAMIAAGLGEEDIAARLEVDPKTVRRWMDGRAPHRRHRWELAVLLGADSSDLWPELRGERPQPGGVVALYPRRDAIPGSAWVRLLGSATREIAILGRDGSFPAAIPGVLDVLGERAGTGVRVRVCLRDPDAPSVDDEVVGDGGALAGAGAGGGALGLYAPLRQRADLQVRLHRDYPYSEMCLADDGLIVLHRVYGVPVGQCPVLQLQRSSDSAVFATYVAAFERLWADAASVNLGDL